MNKYSFKVGNYAKLYENENYIITEHDIQEMEKIDTDAFVPIELSEEWIMKLGFTKPDQSIGIAFKYYTKEVNKQEKIQIVLHYENITEVHLLYVNNFGEEDWDFITTEKKFFYVHKIQNLISDHSKPGYPNRY